MPGKPLGLGMAWGIPGGQRPRRHSQHPPHPPRGALGREILTQEASLMPHEILQENFSEFQGFTALLEASQVLILRILREQQR